jgi:hypothetical protein
MSRKGRGAAAGGGGTAQEVQFLDRGHQVGQVAKICEYCRRLENTRFRLVLRKGKYCTEK